jgi:hypothetical protein
LGRDSGAHLAFKFSPDAECPIPQGVDGNAHFLSKPPSRADHCPAFHAVVPANQFPLLLRKLGHAFFEHRGPLLRTVQFLSPPGNLIRIAFPLDFVERLLGAKLASSLLMQHEPRYACGKIFWTFYRFIARTANLIPISIGICGARPAQPPCQPVKRFVREFVRVSHPIPGKKVCEPFAHARIFAAGLLHIRTKCSQKSTQRHIVKMPLLTSLLLFCRVLP